MFKANFDALAYSHGTPDLTATFKSQPADFVVDEIMPVTPNGEGEHVWLKIRKTNANTEYVARQLADHAQVKPTAVSYAGLKDRQGVTTQWFSVHLPGISEPNWQTLLTPEITIIETHRHYRKLKRGTLSGNAFKILLRNIVQSKTDWLMRLETIKTQGIPNYFGPQRFGHAMQNLSRAEDLFIANKMKRLKHHKRSLFLSAARSWIFNNMVSERIQSHSFNHPLSGDVFMLDNSHSCFCANIDTDIEQRLNSQDIHLTAALWGSGNSLATEQCWLLEQSIASQYPIFAEGLMAMGLKQERRAIRLIASNMHWQWINDQTLQLQFELPAGSYATSVIRELCQYQTL